MQFNTASAAPVPAERTLEPLSSLQGTQRLPTPAIPWHAQRKAKAFLENVAVLTTHDKELIGKLTAPIVARIQRKPGAPIRPEMLVDFQRDWTLKLGGDCRLALIIDKLKRGICITDCRISLSQNSFEGWPQGYREPGLAVLLARVTLVPNKSDVTSEMLAGVSEHCLGRWFERSPSPSPVELFEELRRILIVHERLIKQFGRFAYRTPHGAFVGDVDIMRSTGDRVLCVRSFLGPKELQNVAVKEIWHG